VGDRGSSFLRFLDRFGGIPLVAIIGALRKKQVIPEKPWNQIGILATAAIGDTILLSAVIKDFENQIAESRIFLFVGDSNLAVSKMFCSGVTIIPVPVSNPVKAVGIIRSYGFFDLWLDFGPWPRINAVISNFIRAGFSLGFLTPGQHRHYAYDSTVAHSAGNHEIDNLRRLVDSIGVHSTSVPDFSGYSRPEIYSDYFVIHMFPGGYKSSYKEWSIENWILLIDGLTERGFPVVLTGAGKDQVGAELVYKKCKKQELIINKAGKINLSETAGYLEHSRTVVSVNTGIMHLAAALGSPLIALHGPTNVNRWGPLSKIAVNFTASSRSSGCLHLGFEYDSRDRRSLDTVDSREVLETAIKMYENQ
jgi:ADP-heptose:LPS heptosyltransferase